jgi:hypothetical protein
MGAMTSLAIRAGHRAHGALLQAVHRLVVARRARVA